MKISVPVAKNPDGSSITGPSYEYIVFDNAKSDALRADLSGGDAGQVAGDAHRARAPGRPAGDGARERLGIRRLPVRPSGCCRPERRSSRATSTSSRTRRRIPSWPRSVWRRRATSCPFCATPRATMPAAQSARRRRAAHLQLSPSRSPHARLNDFQALGFNEDEDGRRVIDGMLKPDRRRQRRSNQLSLRADRKNRAQPPEPPVPGRRVPVRLSGVDRSSQRQDRRA